MHLPEFLKTDRPFVPLNLGGNPFGWTADEEASFAVLDRFVDGGGSFVDTADAYSSWVPGHTGGESERIIGAWLAKRGLRDQVQIATKVAKKPDRMGLARETVHTAVEESRERLGIEVIDLCYAHADDEKVPVEDQVETFHALVEAGHIRAVGLSNYNADRLREWVTTAHRLGLTPPAAIQPRYTLVSRSAYEQDLAPVVAELGLAVFSFPALASGFLTGKYRSPRTSRARPAAPPPAGMPRRAACGWWTPWCRSGSDTTPNQPQW
ncbi:aldo/keto reductase [Ornithinimicrobium pratense]|uniref:aldo/keto reductase n=1 Tax=Ornithinimicrobium pratense TaxID=2593973 RepID=UPI00307DF948